MKLFLCLNKSQGEDIFAGVIREVQEETGVGTVFLCDVI